MAERRCIFSLSQEESQHVLGCPLGASGEYIGFMSIYMYLSLWALLQGRAGMELQQVHTAKDCGPLSIALEVRSDCKAYFPTQ